IGWLDLSVPPKPQCFMRAHDIGEGNCDAACPCGLAQIQHAIGDHNEPAHSPSVLSLPITGGFATRINQAAGIATVAPGLSRASAGADRLPLYLAVAAWAAGILAARDQVPH